MIVLLWLKARWKWVLGVLAILGVFLLGFFSRKAKVITPSNEEEEKKKIEASADTKVEAAAVERDKQVGQIVEQHAETIQKLDETQQADFDKLKDDPDALNSWLLDVGQKARQ